MATAIEIVNQAARDVAHPTLEERASIIADEANECCGRSDGYAEAIRDLALQHLSEAIAAERERCAKIAEKYSNARPGDICEVQAGDWQAGIAAAIRDTH